MKKIVCPLCGEINNYFLTHSERTTLFFDSDGKFCWAKYSKPSTSTVRRCPKCKLPVTIERNAFKEGEHE